MNTQYASLAINDNKVDHHFELLVDGHKAFIDYRIKDQQIYLVHTEVPPALQGKGVGSVLVEKVLQLIAERKWQLIPRCTFVKAYLEKNPRWKSLIGEEA